VLCRILGVQILAREEMPRGRAENLEVARGPSCAAEGGRRVTGDVLRRGSIERRSSRQPFARGIGGGE